MSDNHMKKAIQAQQSGEIGAFKVWCEQRGLDFRAPESQTRFWDEHWARIERESIDASKKKPAT